MTEYKYIGEALQRKFIGNSRVSNKCRWLVKCVTGNSSRYHILVIYYT